MRHKARLLAPLAIIPFVVIALAGCDGDTCAAGQRQVIVGYIPVTTMAGKVPIVNMVPQYACQEVAK